MSFDIFAKDFASKTFDKVGDSAERLGRRMDSVGKGASSVGGHFGTLASGIGSAGVSIIGTSAKLATFAGAAASAASSVGGLVAALAPAGGIVAALPGAVALAQAAMLTLKVATIGVQEAFGAALGDDAKKFEESLKGLSPAAASTARELRALKPELDGLKNAVQDSLFAPLQGQLTALAAALAGPVRDGMSGVASEFGLAGVQVAEFARSAESVAAVQSIFSSLRDAVAGLRPAIEPVLAGFRDLAVVGASFSAGLTPGIAGAAARFGEFLSRAAESGQALQWMTNAVSVFKELGAIAKDVGGILGGIFDALRASGGGALGIIGQLLDGLNAFVNSAAGQSALVEIFTALRDIGQAFLPVLKAVVSGLGEIAPVVADLAKEIGPVLAGAINAVVPALKALGPGVIAVFRALGDVVGELASSGALTDIASAMADIMIAVAQLLPGLVGALIPALKAIGPGIVTVFQALGQAIGELAGSGALTDVATAMADIMIALAPLLPALASVLIPALQFLAGLVTTSVAPALETLVGWIKNAVEWISTGGGMSEDSWLVRVAMTIRDAALPIWQQITDLLKKVFDDIAAWAQNNQGQISEWGDRIISIIKTVGEIVSGVFEFIALAWDTIGGPMLDSIGTVFGAILQIIDGILTEIKGVVNIIMGALTGDWSRAWDGVKQIFSGAWEAIGGLFTLTLEAIKISMGSWLTGIGADWDKAWTSVATFFGTVWNGIVANVSRHLSDLGAWFGNLARIIGDAVSGAKDNAIRHFTDLVNWVRGIPGQIRNALGDLGSLLYESGRSIIQGLINGLYSMLQAAYNAAADILNRIRALFPSSPAKEGPFSGRGWTLYSGQALAEGFAEGMAKGRGLVGTAAKGLASAAAVGVGVSPVGVSPVTPVGAGGGIFGAAAAPTLVFNFSGRPLISGDEIFQMVQEAIEQASRRGFPLGVIGGTT